METGSLCQGSLPIAANHCLTSETSSGHPGPQFPQLQIFVTCCPLSLTLSRLLSLILRHELLEAETLPLIAARLVPHPCSSLQIVLPCAPFLEAPLWHRTSLSTLNPSFCSVGGFLLYVGLRCIPAAPSGPGPLLSFPWTPEHPPEGSAGFPHCSSYPHPFFSLREFSNFLLAPPCLKPFNGFPVHSEKGSANYSLQIKSSQPPVFVNKRSLEHSHTHLFTVFTRRLSRHNSRVEDLQQRPYDP